MGLENMADPIERSRMPIGDHIEELRVRLIRALLGFALGMGIGLALGEPLVQFIAAPVVQELQLYFERSDARLLQGLREGDPRWLKANEPRVLHATLQTANGSEPVRLTIRPLEWLLQLAPAERIVSRRNTLKTLSATESFLVYLKVSAYCGIVMASPWIFYQLWAFVAAGLYPQEKRMVNVYLPLSVGLFLAGVALCEFAVLPLALRYLLGFNEALDVEPELRLSEWLGFATLMPLVFGAAFQLPVIMLAVHRIGVVDVAFYRRHRRVAMFAMACLAALLAAAPDLFNIMALAVPLWVLYELGILLCAWSTKTQLAACGLAGSD
jgi:sec-independent protein translocase protein TatC